jgi:hypothetical protein
VRVLGPPAPGSRPPPPPPPPPPLVVQGAKPLHKIRRPALRAVVCAGMCRCMGGFLPVRLHVPVHDNGSNQAGHR